MLLGYIPPLFGISIMSIVGTSKQDPATQVPYPQRSSSHSPAPSHWMQRHDGFVAAESHALGDAQGLAARPRWEIWCQVGGAAWHLFFAWESAMKSAMPS